ncbi:MAG: pentapeptide repeat-containing protein [Pseudomonadota bacterium]
MADAEHIARINALIQNARNTWFALLAALVFVGVTLLSVEPIDFYGVGRATDLPLVGVSVPTPQFFYAAPVLTVAIYAYFHLYLIRLWDELSIAPSRVDGRRLGSAIAPWLIADSALFLRRLWRKDHCAEPRALEVPSVFWNILFAWAAGPLVLGYLWVQSLPARDTWMSGIAAAMIILSLVFFMGSGVMLVRRMRAEPADKPRELQVAALWTGLVWVTLSLFVASETWHRTHPEGKNPARLVLAGEQVTERPEGWLPPQIARAEARQAWCNRYGHDCKALSDELETRFEEEDWTIRRDRAVDDLKKPETLSRLRFETLFSELRAREGRATWPEVSDDGARATFAATLQKLTRHAPDFRDADLRDAFLAGANLTGARFVGARATRADFERARLDYADLSGSKRPVSFLGTDANFQRVVLTGASLVHANLRWADLRGAQMRGANLFGAYMPEADLRSAQMDDANLFAAQMRNASLRSVEMNGTRLFRANMRGVNLVRARMEDVDLFGTDLRGANLNTSYLAGTKDRRVRMTGTDLSGAQNAHGALRFVNMTGAKWDAETDFREVFMDGSVTVSADFRARMGNPCQWLSETLDTAEFNSMWRWWLQLSGNRFWLRSTASWRSDLRDVPLPTPERLDALGLTDCVPDQPFGPMPGD